MRILVIGSGAREHAILWKLSQSDDRHELFVCPGNVGMDKLACRLAVQGKSMEEFAALALRHRIELTIVGPESYLVDGIVDLFQSKGLRIFGPTAEAARLEGSKIWAKEVMQRVGIPTASWYPFSDHKEARQRAADLNWRCVIKADGLAAGKGAFVCHSEKDADDALDQLSRMGKAASTLLVEELLEGPELSVFAITDGQTVLPFGAAQDHKRLRDRDQGPNTGGMGAYSPVNHMLVAQGFADSFFQPLVTSLRARNVKYVGVLYAGAIVTDEGPKILEFNCRFGDPEAEVLLRRLDSDLASLLSAATDGVLHTMRELKWSPQESLCVVAVSNDYPENIGFGSRIKGIDDAQQVPGVMVFHGGTDADPVTGQIITNGGRILCVTSIGENLPLAHERAYDALREITFDGMRYRTDIGTQALPETWKTSWRKPPRWEQQMRTVTVGLDSLASKIQRLQLSDLPDSDTATKLQSIYEELNDLKLQATLPEDLGAGPGLRLTWSLLSRYIEVLNAAPSEQISAGPPQLGDVDEDLEERPRVDALNLPLVDSAVRFERHREYNLLAWNSRLTADAAIKWLEKQRGMTSSFYVETNSFTYQFDRMDNDIVALVSEAEGLEAEGLSEVISVRLEASPYTCIWSAPNHLLGEHEPTFALLSPVLTAEDVWWFMQGTMNERGAEEFGTVLEAIQELAEERSASPAG